MSSENQEYLSVADFLLILWRRRFIFIGVFALVIAAAVVYLLVAKKTYRLSGVVYVGRFQALMLEEGEFVAKKLQDYSFIKKALDNNGVTIDIPIMRLAKQIDTEVINEVKKVADVGIVRLTVEYKDREMVYRIFKALTDQLIADHGELLEGAREIFRNMEQAFWEKESAISASIEEDEKFIDEVLDKRDLDLTIPSHLLLQHTISEKENFQKKLLQDIYYIHLETKAATKSFNTKLGAEPAPPDEHYKPKTLLTLVLAAIIGGILATLAALSLHLYAEKLRPRIKAS